MHGDVRCRKRNRLLKQISIKSITRVLTELINKENPTPPQAREMSEKLIHELYTNIG